LEEHCIPPGVSRSTAGIKRCQGHSPGPEHSAPAAAVVGDLRRERKSLIAAVDLCVSRGDFRRLRVRINGLGDALFVKAKFSFFPVRKMVLRHGGFRGTKISIAAVDLRVSRWMTHNSLKRPFSQFSGTVHSYSCVRTSFGICFPPHCIKFYWRENRRKNPAFSHENTSKTRNAIVRTF